MVQMMSPPGLTGLAQINGRDKLHYIEKARLDGEYVEKISLATDIFIFLKTLFVFEDDTLNNICSRSCHNKSDWGQHDK